MSYREIAEAAEIASVSQVEHHLRILQAEGMVKLIGTRAIEVLDEH